MDHSLIERLEREAQEYEDESACWQFDTAAGTSAAAPYLQTAALLREAAKGISETTAKVEQGAAIIARQRAELNEHSGCRRTIAVAHGEIDRLRVYAEKLADCLSEVRACLISEFTDRGTPTLVEIIDAALAKGGCTTTGECRRASAGDDARDTSGGGLPQATASGTPTNRSA